MQYKFFANTVSQCPEYWDDEEQIRADLELEATGNDKAETFLAMVRAQRALVERFLAAELDKADDAGAPHRNNITDDNPKSTKECSIKATERKDSYL